MMRTQLGAVYQPQFWEAVKHEDIASQYAGPAACVDEQLDRYGHRQVTRCSL